MNLTPTPPPGRTAAAALLPLVAVSLVLGAVLASGGWYRVDDVSDVGLYLDYGRRLLAGQRPYLDFAVEYPPLALPLFVLPAAVPDRWLAARAFNLELWLLLAAAALCATRTAARGDPGGRAAWPTGLAFAAGAAALGAVAVNRFDGAVALVVGLALLFLGAGRTAGAAAALGAGFALKLAPAALLPLVALAVPDGRAAVRAGLAFLGAAAIPFLPALALAPDGVARLFAYHHDRPLQLEAVAATPLLLGRLLGGPAPPVASAFGSQNLASPLADALAAASGPAALGAVVLVTALAWRRREALRRTPDGLALAALALLLALLATSKVLSPQYLAWLLPALALVLPARPALGVLVVGALLLTHLEFPHRYWALVAMRRGPVALVVLRNAALVAALVLALRALWRLPATGQEVTASSVARTP